MAPNNNEKTPSFSIDQLVAPCGRQQLPAAKDKIDDNPNIGTYKSAVTPLLVLALSIVCGHLTFRDLPIDKRTDGAFLRDSPFVVYSLCTLYVMFSMVWGPQYMKNRKPLELKNFMLFYNAFQVALSGYMFYQCGLAGWFFDYNLRCELCDRSPTGKPMLMVNMCYLFFLSKILDFVDTGLFITRGKLKQVSNLHVIHHSCMVISMWYGSNYMPGGHFTFLGFLNSFVHTVMYGYYLLAGLGPKVKPYLWWKKYLTRIQLIQFVAIFLHAAQLLVFPCEGFPIRLVYWTLLYSFLFFALFINFYIQAYLKGSKKKAAAVKDKKSENGKSEFISGKSTSKITEVIESSTVRRIQANVAMAT